VYQTISKGLEEVKKITLDPNVSVVWQVADYLISTQEKAKFKTALRKKMHDLKMPSRIDLEAIFVQVVNKICPLDPIVLGDFYNSHHSTVVKMAAEVRKTWKQAIQAEYRKLVDLNPQDCSRASLSIGRNFQRL